MTLAIHEQGGLTEAEIKLAIEESAERREAAMDTKLAAHRAELRADLAQTNSTIEVTNQTVTEMQRELGTLTAETSHQTELLEGVVRRGEEWHAADLEFRATMLTRVGAVEQKTTDLADAVSRLRVIGVLCFWVGRVARFSYDSCRDAEFWKLAATLILLYLLALFFPTAAHLLEGGLK